MDRVVHPDIADMCAFFASGMNGLGKRKRDPASHDITRTEIQDLVDELPLADRFNQMRRLRTQKRLRITYDEKHREQHEEYQDNQENVTPDYIS